MAWRSKVARRCGKNTWVTVGWETEIPWDEFIENYDGTYNQERMVGSLQHAVFCHRMLDFTLLNDDFFLEDFDGVQFGSGAFTTKDNSAIGTVAKNLQEFEVFKCLTKENSSNFHQNCFQFQLTIFFLPLIFPVEVPRCENFSSKSSSSAIDAISISSKSSCSSWSTSLKQFATLLNGEEINKQMS